MAVFQPQIVGKGGATYIAGKGINIDEESKEISVVDPVLVNESTIEGIVQIGDYELLDSNGTIPEDRLANTTSAIQGQILTLDINKNAIWADPDALPASTKYGASLVLSIDSGTYVVTAQLKDQYGNNLGNPQTIDLPLESVVISGRYDESTKKVILTLQNGSTVEFSIADLVDGLQNQMQFSNMPEASSTNEGMVIQYIGGTIPDVDPTAVATQTVGSGLTNLSVDVKKFESAEQPSGAETVSFVASVVPSSVVFTVVAGNFTVSIPYSGLRQLFIDHGIDWDITPEHWSGVFNFYNGTQCGFGPSAWADWVFIENIETLSPSYGLVITGSPDPELECNYANYVADAGSVFWSKNGTTVDFADYGISYSGTPADGDTISVAYTPGEKGITQGYFYANQPKYSDASATISQTVGSGLTDLSVNVDKFVEAEHPTQSGNTSFVCDVTQDNSIVEDATVGLDYTFDEQTVIDYFNGIWGYHSPHMDTYVWGITYAVYTGDDVNGWVLSRNQDGSDYWSIVLPNGLAINSVPNIGDYIAIRSTMGSVIWSKNSTTIDFADYGISYSGTPADGDTLTVAYTAPVITGYEWNQINVQPSSSSGGGGGIEWKATLDLPVNYSGPQFETSAIVTIPGGLPDGDYEFYYRTLCYSEPKDAPKRYATTKVQFHFDSANSTCIGSFAPVIDGNWMPSGNYSISSLDLWNVFGSHKKDFVFSCTSRPFATDVPAYNDVSGGLKDCFKVSLFKNIHTGQEYIPVLALYDGTSNPKEFEYAGHINMKPLQNEPYIPQYHTNTQWNYDDSTQFARLQPYIAISNSRHPAQCSELDVSLVSSNGGKWHCIVENGYDSYVARVLEASGDLANAQIGFNGQGETFLFFNTESGTFGIIYVSIGAKGSSETASCWSEAPDSFTPATITKVGMTVTADNLGMIEQYTGETDSTYTNGYFYKATGDEVVFPATTVCNQTFGEETIDITCLDFDGLVAALAGYIGWSEDYTKEELSNGHFMAYRPAEYNKWYFDGYGEIPDSVGIGNYFTLSPEPSSEIQFTVNHTESHTGIQNGRWEQVDVQPSSGGLPDQTGHTGFLQTDGTEASWSDKAPLVNDFNNGTAQGGLSINVTNYSKLTNTVKIGNDNTSVGMNAHAYRGTAIGNDAAVSYVGGTAIGRYAETSQMGAIAIGDSASSTAQGTILLNASNTRTTNQTPDTFMVANTQGAYTLMSADGTIPAERLAADGTTGQVLSKTDTGMEWKDMTGGGPDNNGLEGDYATAYGIVDETTSGLPYIKTEGSAVVVIPSGLVLDIPGQSGLTTISSAIEYTVISTANPTLFYTQDGIVEATDVFFQIEEPKNTTTGYAAWWNGTTWQFKNSDTGNVWSSVNAARIAKTVFTDGTLTRLCFTGCRVLNKQEWLPKNGITTTDTTFSYTIKTKNSDFTCKCDSYFGLYWAWGIGANFLQYGFGSVGTIGGNSTNAARLYKNGGVYEFYVGTQWNPLDGLYTKTINGGAANAVITVPTVSGTMVVATPPTEDGTYVLKATVVDGVVTTTWVAE